tara:strand:+ start:2375 stop:3382 length:1008 start_codon:yes stop_codon:yes gene_type:complete
MDILQNIDTNVSSMVSSSFDEFISTKVKEAVEKEKEKFLTDLNMCEEEYPFNKDIPEFRIEGLCFPGLGAGASERAFYYITNLGNIYYLPHDCDKNYQHPYMLNPPRKPEIIKWGRENYKPVKLNNEYIQILKLLRSFPNSSQPKKWNPLLFFILDIYKKYHPRANENFVIEEKIKKLSQIEKVVEEKVEEEKNSLEKQKEIYSEKVKQVNEEKLKRIFSMFILRNEREENIKDKSTIREMIKRSNDKCKKKEREIEINLEKKRDILNSEKSEFQKEQDRFYEEKKEYENSFKSKVKSLLDMANDINEINELQDDTLCKSEELFSIMKKLNEFIK